MKPADIPFNMEYHFDEHLHDVPDSSLEMTQGVRFLKQQLATRHANDPDRLSILGLLGVYARMLGDLDAAEHYLTEAVALAAESDARRAQTANRVRLAHVHQWQGDFERADELYEDIIRECESSADLDGYLDFACQHYGKSLFDQGRYAEAQALFQRALDLRAQSGNEDLVESTRLAMQAVRARLRG